MNWKNIKKILILVAIYCSTIINCNALTIIETPFEDEYDTIENNSILIGITKFSPNTVVTAGKAKTATYNYMEYNNEATNPNIYYYLQGDWYLIDDDSNASVINDKSVIEKLNNSDIFFINNEEKIIELEYEKEVNTNYSLLFKSDNSKKDEQIVYNNGSLYLPATLNSVDTVLKANDNTKEFNLDRFVKEAYNSTNYIKLGNEYEFEDFKYIHLDEEYIQITKYIGKDNEIVIPSNYNGYKVKAVGNVKTDPSATDIDNIFGDTINETNTTIKKVTISEGIEVIKGRAFMGCSALSGTLTLPSTLKRIEYAAFNNCGKLTGDLIIPEGVEFIGQSAFQNCSGFNGKLTLPSTLKEISSYAFNKCKNLTGELVIPEGVESVKRTTFQYCEKFTSLKLPSTLKTIEAYAFNQCKNLKGELIIPEGVVSIGKTAFQQCAGFNKLTLPSTVTVIEDFAFNQCKGFKGDLDLPDNVKVIGNWAFQHTSGFNGILTLPANLEVLGDGAFNHSSNFTNKYIEIPKYVKTLGLNDKDATHMFYNFATKSLEEFRVEEGNEYFKAIDGVLYMKDGTRLISYPSSRNGEVFEIPEGVTIIDELAFSRAGSPWHLSNTTNKLKKLIIPNSYIIHSNKLPDNYLNEGSNLSVGIYKYTGITEIVAKDDNPNYKTINGMLFSKDGKILWYIPVRKAGDVVIPDGVTTIESGAIYTAWDRALNSITIPASVTEIKPSEIAELEIVIKNGRKVIFAEDSIYEVKTDKTIGKK